MNKAGILLSAVVATTLSVSCRGGSHSGEDVAPTFLPVVVVRISDEFANINTSVTGKELAELGITHGSTFTINFRDHTFSAFFGKGYSEVPKGDWVALIEDDEKVQLAISFGNAAEVIGCAVGDTLYIELGAPTK